MKNIFKSLLGLFVFILSLTSCSKTDYSLGNLATPGDVAITSNIVGQDAAHPTGDSSGMVSISIAATNGLSYRVDWDAADGVNPEYIAAGSTASHRYTVDGLHTYTITALVTGPGGQTSATSTKTISVYTKFEPDPTLVKNLTNNASKTFVVDKDVAGHFGVGPYNVGSIRPEWYAAGPNDKAACCNCFYTATFTFTQVAPKVYTLTTNTPDGAFTKTGSLTTIPGIPASGDEGCYSYGGGTSSFTFVPASSGAPKTSSGGGNFNSTQTSIVLQGTSTFIGYGAVLKEYEILTIDDTYVLLRVQGTETGNAWYIRLKAQ